MSLLSSCHNGSDVNESFPLISSNSCVPKASEDNGTLEAFIQDVLYLIITPTVSVFGCLGNFMSLIILIRIRTRSKMKADGTESTTFLGMILLAFSDMVFCIAIFPRAPVMLSATTSLFRYRGFGFYYQMYGTGVISTCIFVSTWITVILSLFRYVGICHPLRARSVLSKSRTRVIYGCAVLMSIVINIPSFCQYSAKPYEINNITYTMLDIGILDLNTEVGMIYLWLGNVLGVILPALILTACNWLLIKALRESQRTRRRCHVHGTHNRASPRITLTLIVIVVLFILLVFPCQIMDFLYDTVRMNHKQIETFLVVRAFANLLQVINFSCNFILYYIVGGQFREMMYETMCFCRRKRRYSARMHEMLNGRSDPGSRHEKYFDVPRTSYSDGNDCTSTYLISYRKHSSHRPKLNNTSSSQA